MIRLRDERDLPACVDALRAVHAGDGYPATWPDAPLTWLTPNRLIAAWVAASSGGAIAHVGLRSVTPGRTADIWSVATGLPAARLGEITRLFVAPAHRRAGLASALFEEACREARRRGMRPVLEIIEPNEGAMRLYERQGWTCVGREASLLWYVSPPVLSLEPLDVRAQGVADAIVELQRAAYAVEAKLIGFADLPPLRERAEDIAISHETFLAATLDGELVGVIGWEDSEAAREIMRLAVRPSHARRGIGRELLRAAIASNSLPQLAVGTAAKNAPAIALYTSQGFAITRTWPAREDASLVLVRLVRNA